MALKPYCSPYEHLASLQFAGDRLLAALKRVRNELQASGQCPDTQAIRTPTSRMQRSSCRGWAWVTARQQTFLTLGRLATVRGVSNDPDAGSVPMAHTA